MKSMRIAEGFDLKLVAAEPLITSPVALTFDAMGRIWAVEMNGYMHDTLGTGEDMPSGKIVILEDSDADGGMDVRKVFLDSLVMPRAIGLVRGGILVAEPSKLWFYEINNDKPGNRVLVDDQYAEGGNAQHQANGLFRALDNWIYSAKSSKRYRWINGKWIQSKTHFRGQWGITQDDHGRLFYNTNSDNILGDYFLPGFGATNQNQNGVAGFNEKIVMDTRVYPGRPTPGVNRGYMDGILDDKLRLKNFTAAAGPVVYRGNLFGSRNEINAFVAEPVGGGVMPGGPVDHALPLLRVTEPNGELKAVLVSYACHGTTLGALNKVHGDWIGEAQKQIEQTHPGAIALVAVGCGADINPDPRYKIEHVIQYAKMIADETKRLLQSDLQPLHALPVGRYKRIQLQFSHIPDIPELVEQAEEDGAKGYYARLSLERIARGGEIPSSLPYPVQTWTFGEDLAMVFLAGEVVVDYSLRLKKELDADRLWVNGYCNEVPSYIASRRVIREGGYEAESSQYSYNRPSPYSEDIEDRIIQAVHDLLPATFVTAREKK